MYLLFELLKYQLTDTFLLQLLFGLLIEIPDRFWVVPDSLICLILRSKSLLSPP